MPCKKASHYSADYTYPGGLGLFGLLDSIWVKLETGHGGVNISFVHKERFSLIESATFIYLMFSLVPENPYTFNLDGYRI